VNYYALFTTMSSGFLLAAPITFPNGGQIPNFKLPDGRTEWMLLGYIGCCGFMLQVLMTAGLQADSSAKATNMMYSQIIFAMILDWLIWGHVPGWGTMIGGCVVLGGVVWGTLQKVEAPRIKDEEYAMVNSVDRELMLEDDDEEEEEDDDDDETETVVAGRKEDDDL
jgi:drug/metabolite transporter (DMT)-like permease